MNANTSIAIVLGLLIVCMAGCFTMESHDKASIEIERQKTKQMELQLQAKIDSLQINYQLINKQRHK